MDVLYFDNHIIVVNKPSGIPTESDTQVSLETEVKLWAKKQYDKSGDIFLRPAHRLDKCVSGIVVFAKTSKALARLHESFRGRQMQKTYTAVIQGALKEDLGSLEDYLVHEEFFASVSTKENPKAKHAKLSYVVRKKSKTASLVEVDLHTGRYHQIRVQFGSRKHPVINDIRYGAKQVGDDHVAALHHSKLVLVHPVSKEVMTFKAPLPSYWQKVFCDLHGI